MAGSSLRLAFRLRDDMHSTRSMTSVSGLSLLSDGLLLSILLGSFGCHTVLDAPPTVYISKYATHSSCNKAELSLEARCGAAEVCCLESISALAQSRVETIPVGGKEAQASAD